MWDQQASQWSNSFRIWGLMVHPGCVYVCMDFDMEIFLHFFFQVFQDISTAQKHSRRWSGVIKCQSQWNKKLAPPPYCPLTHACDFGSKPQVHHDLVWGKQSWKIDVLLINMPLVCFCTKNILSSQTTNNSRLLFFPRLWWYFPILRFLLDSVVHTFRMRKKRLGSAIPIILSRKGTFR